MANNTLYKIIGRYMRGNEVTGYEVESTNHNKNGYYTKEQITFLVGKKLVTNCEGQIYKDKVLLRGVGVSLDSLPVINLSKKEAIMKDNKLVNKDNKLVNKDNKLVNKDNEGIFVEEYILDSATDEIFVRDVVLCLRNDIAYENGIDTELSGLCNKYNRILNKKVLYNNQEYDNLSDSIEISGVSYAEKHVALKNKIRLDTFIKMLNKLGIELLFDNRLIKYIDVVLLEKDGKASKCSNYVSRKVAEQVYRQTGAIK